MIKGLVLISLFCTNMFVYAYDHNLICLLDPTVKEKSTSQEVSVTHELLVALTQKQAVVIASSSLWANWYARAKRFGQGLKKHDSVQSELLRMYKQVQHLIKAHHTPIYISSLCTAHWLEQSYPQLFALPDIQRHMLEFDFFCYIFALDTTWYRKEKISQDLLVFVPHAYKNPVTIKKGALSSQIIQTIQELQIHQDLVIYLSGHGFLASQKSKGRIAGFEVADFTRFLQQLHTKTTTQLLLYSSCYAGGVFTQQGYQLANGKPVTLRFPVIVLSLTDAPVYTYGYYSGVMLPPYGGTKVLTPSCITKQGLDIATKKRFDLFFKKAHQGEVTPELLSYIDGVQGMTKHIENSAQVRPPLAHRFVPFIPDSACAISQDNCTLATQTILLDVVYTKQITLSSGLSLVPAGLFTSYDIDLVNASTLDVYELFGACMPSLADAKGKKIVQIKKISTKEGMVDNAFIFYNYEKFPDFLPHTVDKVVWFKKGQDSMLLAYNQNSLITEIVLDLAQDKMFFVWLKK